MSIEAKQVYEWVKTGHWSKRQFMEWVAATEESSATQEPVAWGMEGKDGFIFDVICPEEHAREEGGYTVPLYTHPQPKREWVGLTDEERHELANVPRWSSVAFVEATEAKLKEKNT